MGTAKHPGKTKNWFGIAGVFIQKTCNNNQHKENGMVTDHLYLNILGTLYPLK